MRTLAPILALMLLAGAAGCAVNPVTKRTDFNIISTEKEKEIGKNAAAEVAAQMGIYNNPDLDAYVNEVGQRLASHSPRQDVTYTFAVIDTDEVNAFALPGGYVYVTRGILVLTNSEDELACVIGHEIGHVAARHSAQQISRSAPLGVLTGITAGVAGLASPILGNLVGGVGQLASGLILAPYSREQEREADRVGQQLAAESGWNPAAMTNFLTTLQREEAVLGARASKFNFLSTHPTTPERIENTRIYATELHRADVPPLTPTRAAFLHRLNGLPTSVRVADGYFDGRAFIQPDFDIRIDFPEGWKQRNTPAAAVAAEPSGDAFLILSLAAQSDDPLDGARKMAHEIGERLMQQVETTTVGSLEAARTVFRARTDGDEVGVDVTWIAYRGNVFQITGVSSVSDLTTFQRSFGAARESFRPLTAEERAAVREDRLRLTEARRGESAKEVVARTGSTWSADMFEVANGLNSAEVPAGETVKVSISEKYE